MLNWDSQLNAILSATDSNVEKIKQRLTTSRHLSKGSMLNKMGIKELRFGEPLVTSPRPSFLYTDIQSQSLPVESPTVLNTSLEMQAKVIESLSQDVQRLEKEKEQQQQRIRKLEEEVHQLRLQSYPGDRSALLRLETKVDEWRREHSNDIFSLREKVQYQTERDWNKTFDSIMEDVNQSKKLLWEESLSLRREIDYLKHRLKRQEEDLLNQISETQDLKRSHDRNNKTLMELTDSYRAHSGASKTKAEKQQREQELEHIRHEVEELKRQLKINFEGKEYNKPMKVGKPGKVKKHKTGQPPEFLSENEDSVSVLSLGDISSDDSSFLADLDLEPNPKSSLKRTRSTPMQKVSEAEQAGNTPEDDDYIVSSDLDGLSDSSPELTLSDF